MSERLETKKVINLALRIIGLDGLMGVIVVAPNMAGAVDKLIKMKKSGVKRYNQQRLLAELKRQNLVVVTKTAEDFTFQLTPKGIHRLQRITIDDIKIPKTKNWDKKWRIILFNVPLRHRKQRQAFTNHLRMLNFKLIRDGAWTYPYPCFNEIIQIAQHYNIARFISLAEASKLDESSLKRLMRWFPELNI